MASSTFIGFFGGAQISYDGTSITFPGPILVPDGSASAPSYSFSGETGLGIFRPANNALGIAWGTAERFRFDATGGLTTPLSISWGVNAGSPDVSLSRGAANRLTLAVGDTLNLAPTAFASLPAGAEGNLACVTDSNTATWGATIAGGGANNVLAFHNGTNWTVAGA